MTQRNIIILTILVLINAIAMFSYFYLFGVVKDKNQRFSVASIEIETEELRNEEMSSLRNIVRSTQDERVSLDTHFIDSNKIVHLLDMIEGLGESSGTELEIVSVDLISNIVNEKTNSRDVLRLAIRADGTFVNVFKLLLLLENTPLEFDFTQVYFSKPRSTVEGANLDWQGNFSMNLTSFLSS